MVWLYTQMMIRSGINVIVFYSPNETKENSSGCLQETQALIASWSDQRISSGAMEAQGKKILQQIHIYTQHCSSPPKLCVLRMKFCFGCCVLRIKLQ